MPSLFFNIDNLKNVTSSYGMEFVNRIHIIPGSKTVRLYGRIGHFKSSRRNPETKSKLSRHTDDDQLRAMKARKKELDKSLRDRTNELYQFLQDSDSVRGLKKTWRTNFEEQKQCYEKAEDAQERDKTSDLTKTWKAKVEEKDERYQNVETAKLRKRGLMVAIRDTKERLQSLRREIHEYGKPLVDDLKNLIPFKLFTMVSKGCCRKIEECKLDEDMDMATAVFSGTDNGIIKTTETVFFYIDRFASHLKLYNRFQILEDTKDADNADGSNTDEADIFEHLTLPRTLTLGSKQINQDTGLATFTNSLTRKKKTTEDGYRVLEMEIGLGKNSLYQCSTADGLEEAYSHHTSVRALLRSFYYSQSMAKRRRRLELSYRKGFDRLAAYERKSSSAKRPIMFVGDRGHGFGSRIKGHRRFGGFWKQQRHGRYTPTLITKEHNTSQTCVFSFHKLSHPVAALNGKIQGTAGSFLCLNPECPNTFKTMCRDQVSALAIGLGCLLFGVTFPCFDPNPTTAKRIQFNNLALSFLYRKQILGSPFDGGNTL